MFQINEDNSIYVTRGDILFFSVSVTDDGEPYVFNAGDIARMKVFAKKNCKDVVLEKDFPIPVAAEIIELYLSKEETKIGDVISKPTDYWYEVTLNPDTNPQTIIGYNEDGPAIFKLFPEGADVEEYEEEITEEDIPFVDKELDLLSTRPVQNKVVAAAILKLEGDCKNYHITPQMFGARGDGVTDDTRAIKSMISYAVAYAPTREFLNEASCNDFTHVTMRFHGQYLITEPICFEQTYGVKIDGLNLIAGEGFAGDGMLMFIGNNRTVSISNTTINGQLYADTCIYVNDYTLTTDLTNIELTQFKRYGFFADAKGHETKMANVRISQVEWGRKSELSSLVTEGTGLYLGAERHDNNFTNVIVSYCRNKTIDVNGSANTFVNCHFYGGAAYNNGHWNVYQNCYFDGVKFYTMGFFTLSNCFFNRADDTTAPFIYLLEASSNVWRYYQAAINGTMFRATTNVPAAINYGSIGALPEMNTIGNTFYNVEPFVSQSKGVAVNPWQRPYAHTGEDEKGYIIISDIKFIWGTATANGYQEYPEGVELTHTFYIGCQRMDGTSEIHPFANDIRTNKFYLNGSANGKVKWLVIGR